MPLNNTNKVVPFRKPGQRPPVAPPPQAVQSSTEQLGKLFRLIDPKTGNPFNDLFVPRDPQG